MKGGSDATLNSFRRGMIKQLRHVHSVVRFLPITNLWDKRFPGLVQHLQFWWRLIENRCPLHLMQNVCIAIACQSRQLM